MYNYNRGNDMRAVYIHIPFCRNICSYCDFCKFLHKEEWARLYLDSLSKDFLWIKGKTLDTTTIYEYN